MRFFLGSWAMVTAIAIFVGYSLYWIIFVPFLGVVLFHGGWDMLYDFVGLSDVASQKFFWVTVILNPYAIFIAWRLTTIFLDRSMYGANNVEL